MSNFGVKNTTYYRCVVLKNELCQNLVTTELFEHFFIEIIHYLNLKNNYLHGFSLIELIILVRTPLPQLNVKRFK